MEFNNIYLPNIIINEIYNQIDINNLIEFTHISSYTYNNFRNQTRLNILKLINKNYKLFKRYLNIYKYNQLELDNIGILCAINTNEINTTLYNYYDLRYIFESLFYKSNIDTKLILNKPLCFMINSIKKCLSFNRFETIYNINNEICLYPLHYNFIPDDDWEYI